MTNPAITSSAPRHFVCQLNVSCHRWLDQARSHTSSPTIQRLIDDVHADIDALGPIGADLQETVHSALESVAVAIDIDQLACSTASR